MRQGDPTGHWGEGVPDSSWVGWAQKVGQRGGQAGPHPCEEFGAYSEMPGVTLLQAPLAVRVKAAEQ